MIELTDTEVDTLLTTMALESDGQDVRQIAVMDGPDDLEFSDQDTGELFGRDTVARIHAFARARTYHCDVCGEDKSFDKWSRDSHGVDMCADCLVKAEMENSHSDGHHADEPDPACPDCQRNNG